jgi:hypothetical protein
VRFALMLVVVVVLAMEVGYVAHDNNVRLAVAYGIGE